MESENCISTELYSKGSFWLVGRLEQTCIFKSNFWISTFIKGLGRGSLSLYLKLWRWVFSISYIHVPSYIMKSITLYSVFKFNQGLYAKWSSFYWVIVLLVTKMGTPSWLTLPSPWHRLTAVQGMKTERVSPPSLSFFLSLSVSLSLSLSLWLHNCTYQN